MKYIASAVGGFALACLLFSLLVYPYVKNNWRNQGQTEGYLKAGVAMQQIAARYFPKKTPQCTPVAVLGGAKPDIVEVVDCGAFRTLRVNSD